MLGLEETPVISKSQTVLKSYMLLGTAYCTFGTLWTPYDGAIREARLLMNCFKDALWSATCSETGYRQIVDTRNVD